MPQKGEIKTAKELGKEADRNYIWAVCEDCGRERWVQHKKYKTDKCRSCSLRSPETRARLSSYNKGRVGDKSSAWKGGRGKNGDGYIVIKLQPDDFFYPTADKRGQVLESRLVVAKALGRNLQRWEVVHHKGAGYPIGSMENKQDNRYPENLEIEIGKSRHSGKMQCPYCQGTFRVR